MEVTISSIFAFIAAGAVGLGLALASFWLAKRSGLTNVQATLIETLQTNTEALERRIGLLEDELKSERTKVGRLEGKVKTLEATVLDLSQQNAALKKSGGVL